MQIQVKIQIQAQMQREIQVRCAAASPAILKGNFQENLENFNFIILGGSQDLGHFVVWTFSVKGWLPL